MKRTILLFLSAAMCLALNACGRNDTTYNVIYVRNEKRYSQPVDYKLEFATCSFSSSNAQNNARQEGVNNGSTYGEGNYLVIKMGDVNGDGKVNYNDAMLVLRASVGLTKIDTEMITYADVDRNGKINYSDAMKILRCSVGLEELPPLATEPPATEPPVTEPPVTEPSNDSTDGNADFGSAGDEE